MLLLTTITNEEVLIDPSKIATSYQTLDGIVLIININEKIQTTFYIKNEYWNTIKGCYYTTNLKDDAPFQYNYYLGYIENGYMCVHYYIGKYDDIKKYLAYPKEFNYKKCIVDPLRRIFTDMPKLSEVFILKSQTNKSLLGYKLSPNDLLTYNVTTVDSFSVELNGALMVDGQKII